MERTGRASVIAVVGVLVAAILGGCSSGPSQGDREEFDRFALERQGAFPEAVPASRPTSIQQYVLGGAGIDDADYIVAGSFTSGRTADAPQGTSDPAASTLIGEFKLHQSLRGAVPSVFDVNLGMVRGAYPATSVVRGAGDVVLFLTYDAATGEWALVDEGWALAQSDGGNLSMPLVPESLQSRYLTGVVDVADVQALIIAGRLDPNGSLNGGLDDLGNDGISGTQQDLIDRANDLAD